MAITTKDELAKQVAERTGLEVGQAKSAVDATIAEITASSPPATRSNSPASANSPPSPAGPRGPQPADRRDDADRREDRTEFSPGAELKKAVNG